jgi:hypothetical protein
MTKKEWIQAMLDGKKVTSSEAFGMPITYEEAKFIYSHNKQTIDINIPITGLRLYQEPMEVDTPLWVWFSNREYPMLVAFSHYDGDGNVVCFDDGCTSKNMDKTTPWKYWEKVCK